MSTSRLTLILKKWGESRALEEGCGHTTTKHSLESEREQLHDLRKEICHHRKQLYGLNVSDKCFGCVFSALRRDPFPMKQLVGELSHALKTIKNSKNMGAG